MGQFLPHEFARRQVGIRLAVLGSSSLDEIAAGRVLSRKIAVLIAGTSLKRRQPMDTRQIQPHEGAWAIACGDPCGL